MNNFLVSTAKQQDGSYRKKFSVIFVFIFVIFRSARSTIFTEFFTRLFKACNEHSVAFIKFHSFRFSPMYIKLKR